MADPFDSPWQVLNRARHHINDLDTRIKAFFDRQPYTNVIEHDSDTRENVYKIRLTAKIPGSLAAVAKDAFSNLRDCLDHTVYASAASVHPERGNGRTAFPFAYDAAGVHDKLNRELTDVPPDIRSLLEGFRPYKGGNEVLWSLNQTRNTKTHRMLVPLGAASIGNSINFTNAVINGSAKIGYNRWDPEKNEVEFLRMGAGSQFQCEANVSFEVLLGDVEGLGGKPAVATLNALSREVEGILMAIEAETARILRS